MKINYESLFFNEKSIKVIEEKYNAKYIYETEMGGNTPVAAIFYQENPPKNYSNWVAFYRNDRDLYVTSAEKIVTQPIIAIHIGNDEWIYSHYTHHFCEKNNIAIDGGRSYTRIVGGDIKNIQQATFIPTKNGLVKQENITA